MANYADSTRTPRTLTEREQRALLKVTDEHRAGYRDHLLYAMALGMGLREHELIALSVGDVFRDGRPRRRLLLSVFKGFKGAGKAGGTQEVLLSESLRGKLRRFHAADALGNPDPKTIEFTPVVRPRTDEVIPRCDRCTETFGPE
jgi:integrase/recombinase XerC